MSTEINVTVDRGGLLKRNRQQTTANRQASLDEQQTSKTGKEAESKRQSQQQQNTTDTSNRPDTRKPDLAASRQTVGMLLLPHAPYEPLGVGVAAKSRALPQLVPTNTVYFFRDGSDPILGLFELSYKDYSYQNTGGPDNLSYLAAYAEPLVYIPTYAKAAFNFQDPLIAQRISIGQAVDLYDAAPFDPYVSPFTIKRFARVESYPQFTVEGFVRMGSGTAPSSLLGSRPSSTFAIWGAGFALTIDSNNASGVVSSTMTFIASGVTLPNSNVKNLTSLFVDTNYLAQYGPPASAYAVIGNIVHSQWHHFAIVKTRGYMTLYFRGQQLAQLALGEYYFDMAHLVQPSAGVFRKVRRGDVPVQLSLEMLSAFTELGQGGVAGVRFSARALYTDTFTPPVSIYRL